MPSTNPPGVGYDKTSGSWVVRRQVGGRRVKSRHPSRAAAIRYAQIQGVGVVSGAVPPDGRLSVGATVREWIAKGAAGRADSTNRTYRAVYGSFIADDPLALVRLRDVSADDLAAFWRRVDDHRTIYGGTPGRGTRLVLRGILSGTFRAARLPQGNPMADARVVMPRARTIVPPTIADAERVAAAATDPIVADLVRVAYLTGARQGELLALRWSDVVLDGPIPVLRIVATLDPVLKTRHDPKTRTGIRTLRLAAAETAILRDLRKRQLADGPATAVVFPGRGGAYMAADTLCEAYRVAAQGSGVDLERETRGEPPVRFHDLRHAYASDALSKGLALTTVSHHLGHADPGFTARTYAHLTPATEASDVARMDAARAAARTTA